MRRLLRYASLGFLLLPGLASAALPIRVALPEGVVPGAFGAASGHLFFVARSPAQPPQLWQTDGTPETTRPVRNNDGSELACPEALTASPEWLYFTAAVGPCSVLANPSAASYRTNGAVVERIASVPARRAFVAADRVFFTTAAGARDEALWQWNGAAVRKSDVLLPRDTPAVALGARLLYAGVGADGVEPWQTDGSREGTGPLAAPTRSAAPTEFAVVGAAATFFAWDANATRATLWRTDGSATGTRAIKSWEGDAAAHTARGSARRLYFRARVVPGHPWAMWTSDGTPEGTVPLASLDEADLHAPMLAAGSKLFFVAAHARGTALLGTDGTAGGTVAVAAQGVRTLTASGERVYYPLDDTRIGGSDGTLAGTATLALGTEIGQLESDRGIFTAAGGTLYFTSTGSALPDVALWALALPRSAAAAVATDTVDPPVPPPAEVGPVEAREADASEDAGCSCQDQNPFSPFLGLFVFAFAKRGRWSLALCAR